jgi:hypothetical protein
MLADVPAPVLLLLHEGGWDEVMMVAAALGIAYFIIVWTGRRNRNEDEDDELDEDDLPDEGSSEAAPDQTHQHRS